MCFTIVLGPPTIGTVAAQPDHVASSGRVEVVLANKHRKNLEEIKKEFAEARLANLHVQFIEADNCRRRTLVGGVCEKQAVKG